MPVPRISAPFSRTLLAWHPAILCAIVLGATALHAGAQTALRTEVVAQGLDHPWAIAFIDARNMLVTERSGKLLLIRPGQPTLNVGGLPKIAVGGQGGLLDVIVDSKFTTNRTVYFCYSEAANERTGGSGNSTALASARLSDDGKTLGDLKMLFSQKPKHRSGLHFGCRIVEHPDGTLFMTLGERSNRAPDAQTLDNHHGKVIRIRKDGSVPPDNPFVATNGALPEIWSYGHRNAQGAVLGGDGKLWLHEHGPQGGDEVNRVEAGKNYGWPVITYGEQYGGGKVGDGITAKAGMEQPVHQWTPSIAPSGMAVLQSERYGKAWQGSMFVGSLVFRNLERLEFKNGKVVRVEKLLPDLKERVRDVREGPDGYLYIATDESPGRILRLLPAR